MPDSHSQGRNDNDAIPESEAKEAHRHKKGEVSPEQASFKPDYGGVPAPDDFEGPAGDRAEGKPSVDDKP